MSKPLADDAETYLRRAKQRATPTGQTMEKLASMKEQEIDETMKRIELVKARKALQEVEAGTGMSTNVVVAKLFEGKTVDEINEMLANMTPEAINNLIRLASSLDTNPVNTLVRQGQPQPVQSGNDLLLQYLLKKADQPPPQQAPSMTLKDVVEIVKLMKESSAPPTQAGATPLDILKFIMEYNRPLQESLKSKDKEIMEARLNELKANMPGSLEDQIKYVKEMAPVLGLTGNQTSELDLKLEEMRENRELDMKRLDWEQEKYKMESEADMNKWEQIGKILQGPVGDVVKNLGSAGADRVRGSPKGNNSAVGKAPKPIQTSCPNCNSVIYVDAEADTAVCGHCGAILQKQGGVAPPEPVPPTHVDAPPETPQSTAPSEQGEEEEQEEDEETGPDETKEQQPATKPTKPTK